MKTDRQLESWKKSNPWIVQNIQNSSALCGRFPTREAAEAEANRRGGVVQVSGRIVLFSDMPQL